MNDPADGLAGMQARLNHRMQAARSEADAQSWLAVVAGGGHYLFVLSQAGEIFPWTPIRSIPYTQDWFLGVTNLRGAIFGVVDLANFVSGTPSQMATPREGVRSDARLVALSSTMDLNCTLLIDRLAGLRHSRDFASSAAPSDDAPAYFGPSYTDVDGQTWQEIQLQALVANPEFLSISA